MGKKYNTLITVHLEQNNTDSTQLNPQSTQGVKDKNNDDEYTTEYTTNNIKTNKTIKTDKDNCVCSACENENFPSEEEKKWYAQMKRSYTAWQRDACRTLKIDQPTLARLIEDFEVECRTKSTTHISWANITSHFVDWGRRQVEKQQKQESYGKRNDNRFGVEPSKDANYYEPI